MCAITDHDVVNRKLKELLSNTNIIVPEAVEISAKNYKRDNSLHILYYANTINKKVDLLLENVLFQKKQVLKVQIEKLNKK
jgi:predicted metal-dependent phosphoesterase TrpH